MTAEEIPASVPYASQQDNQQALSQKVVRDLAEGYDIPTVNRIKPGIAEAARAVLRRVPDHVLVSSKEDAGVSLLVYLAGQKGIENSFMRTLHKSNLIKSLLEMRMFCWTVIL